MMKSTDAIAALGGLAHPSRLAIFRLLVRAGEGELAAGDIARKAALPPSTLSSHIAILARAGLVRSRRDGRAIFYSVDLERMTALMAFLIDDCCEGRAELCTPLTRIVQRAVSCGDRGRRKRN
jgi:ArsR family transcriptional regulator, arsenate/arsenite/antimonite-responsive transcriptional repressor